MSIFDMSGQTLLFPDRKQQIGSDADNQRSGGYFNQHGFRSISLAADIMAIERVKQAPVTIDIKSPDEFFP
ncbi:hypothetical protein [Sodalis ligni]|uniref:hypothetical protein n=1 Tax=Sodalis ligni TaxID=2697027 RepID=UPI0010495A9E|nr:hypothetical protein [Sodalis ligni]